MSGFAVRQPLSMSLIAEQTVLGSLLRSGEMFEEIGALITNEAFADPVHASIFQVLTRYWEVDRDFRLLSDDLRIGCDPQLVEALQGIGGLDYLKQIMTPHPDDQSRIADVIGAAKAIREYWIGRRLQRISEAMRAVAMETTSATESPGSLGQVQDQAQYLRLRLTGWLAELTELGQGGAG